jgi:hypothetical protein
LGIGKSGGVACNMAMTIHRKGGFIMANFISLMHRAEALRRLEADPIRGEWWAGYLRGLRRAHHGERFGDVEEHSKWLAAAASDDPMRAARGRGYRAGLTLEAHDPETERSTGDARNL